MTGHPLDRCSHVHPGEEHLGACGVDRYAHDAITGHPFTEPEPVSEAHAEFIARFIEPPSRDRTEKP